MSKINGVTVTFTRADIDAGESNELLERANDYPRPSKLPPGFTAVRVPGHVEGDDHRHVATRLASIFHLSPFVEIEDDPASGPNGEPALAIPIDFRIINSDRNVTRFSATFALIGGHNRFRIRLVARVVRTITNNWSQQGLTRLLLPTGSLYPSDAATNLLVTTPTAHPLTDNWGTQDAAYEAEEVARGYVTFELAPGFYANFVRIHLDPNGENLAAEIPGLTSDTDRLRITHRRGTVDLFPTTSKVLWTENAKTRNGTIAGFVRWTIISWDPDVCEISLGNEVIIEIHSNGLVRLKGLASKLTLDEAANTISSPGTYHAALDGDDWHIASTEDYAVAANEVVTIHDDGDAIIFNSTSAATDARDLFKDIRLHLEVEV